jgi:DNA polymerase sigma
VGSFATGLWSSYSDIDINLVPMDNEYINFETTLEKIYKALKIRKSEFGIDDVYFNKNKINTVKLGLNNKYSNLIVDIAIFYRNNQNRAYVTYILESINAYPQIKPLFFIFKKISETFDLHDHIVGGLKTYTLFLMIYSIIKNLSSQSLGELFNQISLYYGFYYAYEFACEEGDL